MLLRSKSEMGHNRTKTPHRRTWLVERSSNFNRDADELPLVQSGRIINTAAPRRASLHDFIREDVGKLSVDFISSPVGSW
jgi:hypothetical protein